MFSARKAKKKECGARGKTEEEVKHPETFKRNFVLTIDERLSGWKPRFRNFENFFSFFCAKKKE